MYILILIFVMIVMLFCVNNETKEKFSEVTCGFGDLIQPSSRPIFYPTVNLIGTPDSYFSHSPKFYYHYESPEVTPYSHASSYKSDYLNYCDIQKRGSCINSRCVYKSLDECQMKCKNGCRYCGGFGLYRCELQ